MDKFWLNDFSVLFRDKKYLQFVPQSNMSNVQILNAITRFTIYLSILFLLFIDWNSYYFFIPIILIVLCIIMFYIEQADTADQRLIEEQKQLIESINEDGQPCTRPSKTNPFMNTLMYDYIDPDKKEKNPACSHDDQEIKKEVNKSFYDNLFVNVDDLYNNRNSQRQFYTTANTTIPNDQTAFAKWCYYEPEINGCKTNQEECLLYEDVRYKQFNNFDRL